MQTTTVRVSTAHHQMLQELAAAAKGTIQGTAEKAIEEYHKRMFWEKTSAAYAALRSDPEAWKGELQEREAWEVTLSDGLTEE
jgi:predicted transcriptional regulator